MNPRNEEEFAPADKSSAGRFGLLLAELRAFRASLTARSPILAPGENWNEFAREGLD